MTPNPTAPAATPEVVQNVMVAPPSGLVALLGPLLAGFLGPQGSLRRLLFAGAGAALLALNHKLELQLDFQEQALIAGIVVSMVLGSNAKEVLSRQADAKVAVANVAANAQVAAAQAAAPTPES